MTLGKQVWYKQLKAFTGNRSDYMKITTLQGSKVPVTVPAIRARKFQSPKIATLTAYDYTTGRLVDEAGVDIVLVGDSLGTVIQGHETTLPVTIDEMIYHCKCVARGVQRALIVCDMPFMSYQVSIERAVDSACRMLKEGGAAAVKLEGGTVIAETVRRLVSLDIPVMGHVGLTPQSVHRMGGYKVQGRTNADAIIADALALEEAGAFAIVIEGVPDDVAQIITETIKIPTIGIGAGNACDGQVLVIHDLLGLQSSPVPKFVRQYANFHDEAIQAIQSYMHDVREGAFPGTEFSYGKRKSNEF